MVSYKLSHHLFEKREVTFFSSLHFTITPWNLGPEIW